MGRRRRSPDAERGGLGVGLCLAWGGEDTSPGRAPPETRSRPEAPGTGEFRPLGTGRRGRRRDCRALSGGVLSRVHGRTWTWAGGARAPPGAGDRGGSGRCPSPFGRSSRETPWLALASATRSPSRVGSGPGPALPRGRAHPALPRRAPGAPLRSFPRFLGPSRASGRPGPRLLRLGGCLCA